MMKCVLPLILSLLLAGHAAAAAVVAEGRIRAGNGGESGTTWLLVDQEFASPIPGMEPEFTGAIFIVSGDPNNHRYEFGGSFIDEGVSVFLVDEFAEFGIGQIVAGAFDELQSGVEYSFVRDRYLGFRTPSLDFDGGPGSLDPAFGWALVRSGAGAPAGEQQLLVIGSAMAFGAGGIVVGTTTAIPIPEPAVGLCLAVGWFLIFPRRRAADWRPCQRRKWKAGG